MLEGITRLRIAAVPNLRDRRLVLVVDDDPGMLRSVARLLRQLGYASKLFPSADAFARYDAFDNVICILLDIELGDGSGIEVRQGLKARNIFVPVIFMTGHQEPALHEAARRSGCLDVLQKPFTAATLAETLQRTG